MNLQNIPFTQFNTAIKRGFIFVSLTPGSSQDTNSGSSESQGLLSVDVALSGSFEGDCDDN